MTEPKDPASDSGAPQGGDRAAESKAEQTAMSSASESANASTEQLASDAASATAGASAGAAAPGSTVSFTKSYRQYVLGFLLIVYVFNFIDRQILAILAQSIKEDMGLSDTQIGALSVLLSESFTRRLAFPLPGSPTIIRASISSPFVWPSGAP